MKNHAANEPLPSPRTVPPSNLRGAACRRAGRMQVFGCRLRAAGANACGNSAEPSRSRRTSQGSIRVSPKNISRTSPSRIARTGLRSSCHRSINPTPAVTPSRNSCCAASASAAPMPCPAIASPHVYQTLSRQEGLAGRPRHDRRRDQRALPRRWIPPEPSHRAAAGHRRRPRPYPCRRRRHRAGRAEG